MFGDSGAREQGGGAPGIQNQKWRGVRMNLEGSWHSSSGFGGAIQSGETSVRLSSPAVSCHRHN